MATGDPMPFAERMLSYLLDGPTWDMTPFGDDFIHLKKHGLMICECFKDMPPDTKVTFRQSVVWEKVDDARI